MKQLFFVSMLFISYSSFSQQNNPTPSLTQHDYLKKSKHQKTAAWILLGSGGLFAILGSVQTNPDYGESDQTGRTILLVTGLTTIAVSVPLFIASSKNKKKAMSVSFKNEKTPQLVETGLVYKYAPALTLKIAL